MTEKAFVAWGGRETVVAERRRYGWVVIDRATGAAALGPTLERARAALKRRAPPPSSAAHPDWPVKDAALR